MDSGKWSEIDFKNKDELIEILLLSIYISKITNINIDELIKFKIE